MKINHDAGALLKKAREKAGYSQVDVVERLANLGIVLTQSALSKYENSVNSPNVEIVKAFSEIYNVSPLYFINVIDSENITIMTNRVPVYGRIPAGTPFEAIQDILEDVQIPDWLAKKKDLFGLKVVGDSMNKVVPDGFIAVLQKTDLLENGEIGAVLVNGFDATLKKFYKLTDSIVLEPLSYNPEHTPTMINPGGYDVKIIGKLLWCCAAGEIK